MRIIKAWTLSSHSIYMNTIRVSQFYAKFYVMKMFSKCNDVKFEECHMVDAVQYKYSSP